MSRFAQMDQRLSAAMDRGFGDVIRWRPRKVLDQITNGESVPDPEREPRDVPGIVTWKPDTEAQGSETRLAVSSADLIVDFEVAVFAVDGQPGVFEMPQVGDWLVLPEPYAGSTLVQINKPPMSDGTSRALYPCTPVEEE